ncbi:HlyD family efflux transporter periplasmic adaptor subunit [Terrihabitans rhizophilus]|uniref:Peptidase M50 n=1 Tax=Terrihabitans rhizophilus TaxID=3092662 RepID=A0ABU4RLV8_9HYPH|nr:HlyD family efflux transporter periplasmic adaptor subunit [Terrihabitans sp. PJ23]MDX6805808.1 peptidase M50 [Terrihabitans sp. PJ23]
MARSLFSSSWYRVQNLKPRLRQHAQIHRHVLRGQVWYIVQDHQTGRFHRVSPQANLMLCLMNGHRTVAEIWDLVGQRAGDDPPTQDEVIQLLSQLHGSDLLHGEMAPDLDEISERSHKQARQTFVSRFKNPLALRFPLFDPDHILNLTAPFVRPLFSVPGFLLWLALVVSGAVVAGLHFEELKADVFGQVLTATNVALMLVLYPVIKLLHEAGHAYATKVWGGEVHEVGVMMLILMPAPYVDASASAAFHDKWRRAVVGGAGMIVELALAAIAAFVWANAEPGLVRAIAFNTMLIGGVSTLVFNGNPLLRFDGYYILSDLIEIQSLGTRANRYIMYIVQRHLFGIETDNPADSRGEARWFVAYGVLAFLYRVLVTLGIAMFVATKLFFIGIIMAIWSVASLVVFPLWKGGQYLFTSPRLSGRRRRALTVSASVLAGLAALLFLIPAPYATVAEGVVWIPERAQVRASSEGVVNAVLPDSDAEVASGTVLVGMEDPVLNSRIAVAEAQRQELRLRYEAVRQLDRVQAELFAAQIGHIEATLAAFRQRRDGLTVRAAHDGRVILPNAKDLTGRFVRQGDLLGYVVAASDPVVRVVVSQADVDLVRGRTGRVHVRFAEDLGRTVPATLLREVPAAQSEVPSPVLTTEGGGTIALDPGGRDRPRALQSLFLFDVGVANLDDARALGGRVYVRFDHGREAVAWRLLRGLRQVFLSQFNV